MTSVLTKLETRARIVGALVLRDIGMRHGGELPAQVYHMAEPAVILLVILGFHFYGGGGAILNTGFPLTAFVLTGYPQHMMLRHTGNAGVGAVTGSKGMLYHQKIKYVDLIFARLILEITLVILGLFIIFFVLYCLKMVQAPVYLGYFYLGWLFQIWIACAICFIFTGLGLITTIVRRIFIPFAFIMMPFYGIFTMAYTLSPPVRAFFLYSPAFDATEMIRRGYIGDAIPTYFDIPYTIMACLGLTFVGLAVMQHARRNHVA
jgi:capsular polysaccharide transport system permease protein